MNYDDLLQTAIDKIMDSSLGDQIREALNYYQKMQETLYNLMASDDEDSLMKIRIGTVLTFAVVNKLAERKNIKEFSKEDWLEIVSVICDNAINVDERQYSRMVFISYADYIEISIKKVEKFASSDQISRIQSLADEIRLKAEKLDSDEISEVEFIDDCLWIAFEAMMKLLAVYSTKYIEGEFAFFLEAVATLSISYGRLTLLNKENQILEGYLVEQNELDEQLKAEYEAYIKEVESRAKQFKDLIDSAFTSDFKQRLRGSVETALFIGVDEKELLKNTDEIDEFFLM